MSSRIDTLFEIDVKGDSGHKKPVFVKYKVSENIDESEEDNKPSQQRPAILKMKTKRYHEEKSVKPQPGQISQNLRNALGLRSQEIPDYIYRMRELGYPPGWLKKCEVSQESISIIGASSSYDLSSKTQFPKYDCDKLHEYPGFNTYHNYNQLYDNYEVRGFRPMQQGSLIENFKLQLANLGLVDKERIDIRDKRMARDDETMEFNLPENRRKRSKLTKISELETSSSEIEMENVNHQEMSTTKESNHNSLSSIPIVNTDITDEGTVLLVGTIQKPNFEQFSQGISDHRFFENLPNVRGAYSKVKDVIQKIVLNDDET